MSSSTIPEFCKGNRISVALFYKLQPDGKMPRVREVASRRIITEEDETAWRQALPEAKSKQQTAA